MPSDYSKPVYRIDGKEFKTVGGLCTYLTRKHDASAVSAVGTDRTLRVSSQGGHIAATYKVSAPEIGKPMTLERC